MPQSFTPTGLMTAALFAVVLYALTAPFKRWIDKKFNQNSNCQHGNEDNTQ